MEEEICGTIECSGGWACGQHLQPQILGVMMASELKDHFGWSLESGKIRRKTFAPREFSLRLCSVFLRTGRIALSKKKEKYKLGEKKKKTECLCFGISPVFRIM